MSAVQVLNEAEDLETTLHNLLRSSKPTLSALEKYHALSDKASKLGLKAQTSKNKAHHAAAGKAHEKAAAAAFAISNKAYDKNNSKRGEQFETHGENHGAAAADHHTQADLHHKERGKLWSI